ncbi:formate dehydrogenase [Ferrimonas balearica]|uniref:formate dehydrogenase n=1 Tax=Ferrimonas balearica TaxID=44012 RepID=UPI001C99CB3A|nr:formate dehydrogenase [Ferrimonas balearica]MBY5993354.1 formate dehydrogenase [Ferrimonas balearica]
MKQNKTNLERRGLLKALAMAPVAGAAIAAAPAAASVATSATDKQGYRETDHVRRYYAAARGQ